MAILLIYTGCESPETRWAMVIYHLSTTPFREAFTFEGEDMGLGGRGLEGSREPWIIRVLQFYHDEDERREVKYQQEVEKEITGLKEQPSMEKWKEKEHIDAKCLERKE